MVLVSSLHIFKIPTINIGIVIFAIYREILITNIILWNTNAKNLTRTKILLSASFYIPLQWIAVVKNTSLIMMGQFLRVDTIKTYVNCYQIPFAHVQIKGKHNCFMFFDSKTLIRSFYEQVYWIIIYGYIYCAVSKKLLATNRANLTTLILYILFIMCKKLKHLEYFQNSVHQMLYKYDIKQNGVWL